MGTVELKQRFSTTAKKLEQWPNNSCPKKTFQTFEGAWDLLASIEFPTPAKMEF